MKRIIILIILLMGVSLAQEVFESNRVIVGKRIETVTNTFTLCSIADTNVIILKTTGSEYILWRTPIPAFITLDKLIRYRVWETGEFIDIKRNMKTNDIIYIKRGGKIYSKYSK